MRNAIHVEILNHQSEVDIPSAWLAFYQEAASQAWTMLDDFCCDGHVLDFIDVLEIAFVDSSESDRVHREFMDIAGSTDVITFPHGELIICPRVAVEQASEYRETLCAELLRYIVHGMLHLAGHLDDQEKLRIAMERDQELLVERLWNQLDGAALER
jgi:probable rRNA maturation factor